MLRDKRMFSRKVVESDAFLDMGASAQNLYFHLALNADDEGFVSAPKKIMRMIGAAEDDLKMLLAKRFILGFESGVVVIKHWLMNNQLRPERIAKSDYEEERGKLYTKINGAYTFDQAQGKPLLSSWRRTDNQLSSSCRQVDAKLTTECGEMYGIKDKTRQDRTRQDKK
ncbi:MAG: hypothetical protein IJ091_01625 [Oscillospiraceae bacterium]|nr:hypothetical protein [Oscillospiraceae bacterium]